MIAAALLLAATFADPEAAGAGLSAQLMPVPSTTSAAAYALAVARAEGLSPWNPAMPVMQETPGSPLRYRSVVDGRGRTVMAYFTDDSRSICRLRVRDGGMPRVRWRAMHWCAAALGVRMPATPPPPVVSVPRR